MHHGSYTQTACDLYTKTKNKPYQKNKSDWMKGGTSQERVKNTTQDHVSGRMPQACSQQIFIN